MLFLVVERAAGILASQPDPVLPAARIGARRPASGVDLPAVTVGIVVEVETPRGLGRELRLEERGREAVTGDVYAGLLQLEAWAESSTTLEQLTTRIQRHLTTAAESARACGFLRLQPTRLDPAEQLLRQPAVGAAFTVWRQQLGYRFTCEVQDTPTPSEGGPIQRVDVEVSDGLVDSFSIPTPDAPRRPTDG